MTVMMSVLKDNPVTNFSRGFFYPFRAGRFLLNHPALLRFVVFPFLINTLIFSLCVYFGFDFFDGPSPTSGWRSSITTGSCARARRR